MARGNKGQVQSFITKAKEWNDRLVALAADGVEMKQAYQDKSPSLPGTNLDVADVQDMSSLINDVVTASEQPIIPTIDSKYIPSHDGKALD